MKGMVKLESNVVIALLLIGLWMLIDDNITKELTL